MKSYTVYFEIYGKKMKATVEAPNEEGAKKIIQGQLKIHKVEPKQFKSFEDFFDRLSKIK